MLEMIHIQVTKTVADKLKMLAQQEGRSVDEVVAHIVTEYQSEAGVAEEDDSLEALIGMVDADVADLSIRADEIMKTEFADDVDRITR
jgi:Mg2+/Co2+ transporter CorB